MTQVRVFVALCAAFFPALGWAQPAPALPAAKAAAVDAAVAAELKRQELVGVALGVIQDGRIVYLKGYGLADREARTPVTARTVFNWASNSKPLAAVAALQLVQAGKLDLDVDVRKYVPEFPAKDAVITTRHLLTHQSGIPHYTNGKIVPTRRNYPVEKPLFDPVHALDRFNQSPLVFPPGTKTDYSSYAYILLSAVIQKAGAEPFDNQVRTRIARPLGLASLQLDVESNGQPDWSAGYIKGPGGAVVKAPEEAHYWKHGAGGYKSHVADFAEWALGLMNRRLISEATEKEMWTPQPRADGTPTSWGLGVTVDGQGGLRVAHNGKQSETTTRMVLYPRRRQGLVVMCNCGFGDVGALSTAVFKALSAD